MNKKQILTEVTLFILSGLLFLCSPFYKTHAYYTNSTITTSDISLTAGSLKLNTEQESDTAVELSANSSNSSKTIQVTNGGTLSGHLYYRITVTGSADWQDYFSIKMNNQQITDLNENISDSILSPNENKNMTLTVTKTNKDAVEDKNYQITVTTGIVQSNLQITTPISGFMDEKACTYTVNIAKKARDDSAWPDNITFKNGEKYKNTPAYFSMESSGGSQYLYHTIQSGKIYVKYENTSQSISQSDLDNLKKSVFSTSRYIADKISYVPSKGFIITYSVSSVNSSEEQLQLQTNFTLEYKVDWNSLINNQPLSCSALAVFLDSDYSPSYTKNINPSARILTTASGYSVSLNSAQTTGDADLNQFVLFPLSSDFQISVSGNNAELFSVKQSDNQLVIKQLTNEGGKTANLIIKYKGTTVFQRQLVSTAVSSSEDDWWTQLTADSLSWTSVSTQDNYGSFYYLNKTNTQISNNSKNRVTYFKYTGNFLILLNSSSFAKIEYSPDGHYLRAVLTNNASQYGYNLNGYTSDSVSILVNNQYVNANGIIPSASATAAAFAAKASAVQSAQSNTASSTNETGTSQSVDSSSTDTAETTASTDNKVTDTDQTDSSSNNSSVSQDTK